MARKFFPFLLLNSVYRKVKWVQIIFILNKLKNCFDKTARYLKNLKFILQHSHQLFYDTNRNTHTHTHSLSSTIQTESEFMAKNINKKTETKKLTFVFVD